MSQVVFMPTNLQPLPDQPDGAFSDEVYVNCGFCEKAVRVVSPDKKWGERLAGSFFCTFCLRHNHDRRPETLMLSFRAIFGYYYLENYLNKKSIWLAQIEDYITKHELVGLSNPLFSYDPESMMWFVDFRRVAGKIKVEDVLETVMCVLKSLDVQINVPGIKLGKLYGKYRNAILTFHSSRRRPANRPHLIPTLSGCVRTDQRIFDRSRCFSAHELKIRR